MPRSRSTSTRQAKSELEDLLKTELQTTTLRSQGQSGGGCISEGFTYDIDSGKVFIKVNHNKEAKAMFDGEMASLERIAAMDVVKVPEPIKVIPIPSGGAAFVMENLDIVGGLSSQAATLGEQLARLHLKNTELAQKEARGEKYVHKGKEVQAVRQFGFDITTCCGYLPQMNEWQADWVQFYGRKIQQQIDTVQQEYNDRKASNLWSQVLPQLSKFFRGLDIFPALLHGDLWAGNVAQLADCPVIFDPASFYGHAEFDLSISCLFGGFPKRFFDSYFKVIPKAEGYKERLEVYNLFHYLNHWNHFGGAYEGSSISTLNNLSRMLTLKTE